MQESAFLAEIADSPEDDGAWWLDDKEVLC
jgi:hypothetical protein